MSPSARPPIDPAGEPPAPEALAARMQRDLLAARKAGDQPAVTALRTAMAALANAEAPPAQPVPTLGQPVGPTEVARLELSVEAQRAVVAAEIADRLDTAATYRAHDRPEAADELDRQVAVLRAYL